MGARTSSSHAKERNEPKRLRSAKIIALTTNAVSPASALRTDADRVQLGVQTAFGAPDRPGTAFGSR